MGRVTDGDTFTSSKAISLRIRMSSLQRTSHGNQPTQDANLWSRHRPRQSSQVEQARASREMSLLPYGDSGCRRRAAVFLMHAPRFPSCAMRFNQRCTLVECIHFNICFDVFASSFSCGREVHGCDLKVGVVRCFAELAKYYTGDLFPGTSISWDRQGESVTSDSHWHNRDSTAFLLLS